MGPHRQTLDVKNGLIFLLAFVFLVPGCTIGTFDVNYPETWVSRVEGVTGRCPNVAGEYVNSGERRISAAGSDCYSNCGALISELRDGSKVISWANVGDKERIKDRVIEIRQPTNLLVDVIEWKEVDGVRNEMSRFQLSAENGDFQCEEGALWLKTRVHTLIFLISNVIATETRAFNKSKDGALVMKRFTKASGHNLVFPEAYGVGEWVRWPAVDSRPINSWSRQENLENDAS